MFFESLLHFLQLSECFFDLLFQSLLHYVSLPVLDHFCNPCSLWFYQLFVALIFDYIAFVKVLLECGELFLNSLFLFKRLQLLETKEIILERFFGDFIETVGLMMFALPTIDLGAKASQLGILLLNRINHNNE